MNLVESLQEIITGAIGKSWVTVEKADASLLRIDNQVEKIGFINTDNFSIQVFVQNIHPSLSVSDNSKPGETSESRRNKSEEEAIDPELNGNSRPVSQNEQYFKLSKNYILDSEKISEVDEFQIGRHKFRFLHDGCAASLPLCNGMLKCSLSIRKRAISMEGPSQWRPENGESNEQPLTQSYAVRRGTEEHQLILERTKLGKPVSVGCDSVVFSGKVFSAVYRVIYKRHSNHKVQLKIVEQYLLCCVKEKVV